ncbi:TonB-dependent receptor [Pseudoalteromonas sp. SG45-5]|uniref:TonB-dependent receptor n=1 Tax=unclassified Pseudoalteromonas TaxID=194690 RepID=UPI0015FC980A|nr:MULTISPECIES: TonB-dependent receptor [unclassified Pseudoalteromonas]MBB1386063.1 TonB-dependent receptor [Pseudoalteromonas sp. SG45-5]MBB1393876.1 TonB-dependent receptor [Pseudoalteromonas sp. SG44-4]MBB1446074.1 TonB-dependent receptor [Pseudoalteromonas sp. SG41-6]
MKKFKYSLLTLACLNAQAAIAVTTAEEDIERISVYEKQNRVVMSSGLATKSDMSLMETPAPVVIIDRELIESQGVDNLQDLVRNVSGLTQAGNNYGIGDNLIVRGLGANYTYDGMYGGAGLGNTFNPTRSLTNVDSVEILKGPATGLYGMGSAGGVINLIEKKPEFNEKHKVAVELGQWDSYALSVDSTNAITDDLAYRVLAKTASSNGFRDLKENRDEIFTSLKYVFSDKQNIMLSAAYIKDAIAVDSIGHPIRIFNSASVNGLTAGEVTGADLVNDATSAGLQLNESQRDQLASSLSASDGLTPYSFGTNGIISPMAKDNEGEELRFKLTHNYYITDDLFLNQQLQYRNYTSSFARQTGAYNYVYWDRRGVINQDPRAPLVVDDVLYPFAARRQEYRQVEADEKSWQYFADLRYDFMLGGVDNELLLNANYEDRDIRFEQYSIYDKDYIIRDKNKAISYQGKLPYIFDIRNPNWPTGNFEDYDPLKTSNYNKKVQAWGLGIQHVAYINDQFTTRIGAAYNQIKQSYEHLGVDARYRQSLAAPKPKANTSDGGLTYNLGATYQPNEDLSIFVNHSKGRTAYSVLGTVTGNEADRKDSESLSNDLGVRFKAFDDQLLASVVIFESARTNLQYSNPLYEAGVSAPNVSENFFDGKEETKGIELDLNAYLNYKWKINLNSVYQDARDKKNPNSSSYDTRQKGVPYVTASTWVTYYANMFDLPQAINISGGVSYVAQRSTNSTSFGIPDGYVPSYTLYDTAVSYTTDKWHIQLNLNNLFNKKYYSKAMFLGGMPGEERNAKLSFSYTL